MPAPLQAFLAVLREADWLTPARARAYAVILGLGMLAAAAVLVLATRDNVSLGGRPIGTDFLSFWTASQLALEGRPEAAWDRATHLAAQHAVAPAMQTGWYAFFYPPVFLLLCLPLALLPYGAALAAWIATTGLAWLAALRALGPRGWTLPAALVFPGFFVCALHGQNGLLSGALFGAAALALDRRPLLAGLCIGALAYKPHLALLAPLALLAAGRWRAIAGAALTVLALAALATLVLGPASWAGFLATSGEARAVLETGGVEAWKMTSGFAAVRLLGGGIATAYAVQAALALAAAVALVAVLRHRPGGRLEGAAIAAAAALGSPFLLDYDLVVLAVPMAVIAAEAERTGWWPWEKTILLAAFLLPVAARGLAQATGVPIAPVVTAALFWLVLRRAAAAGARAAPTRALA